MTPHTTRLSNARPLYLQKGSAQHLDIDASQRLRIRVKDQGERYIPLHHVSRIVCSHTLEISSRALLACMQRGIPVSILDVDGNPLGWCLGVRRIETSLRQLLRHALDDPLWPELYSEWLHRQNVAVATHALLMCEVPATPTARHSPRPALCNAHFQKHQQPCAKPLDALALLAQQELAAQLAEQASDPQLLAWNRPGLNLLNDLGEVLGWYAHIDLHHAPMLPEEAKITSWSIKHYERHTRHWQQRISQLMHEFEQFLRTHWL